MTTDARKRIREWEDAGTPCARAVWKGADVVGGCNFCPSRGKVLVIAGNDLQIRMCPSCFNTVKGDAR